MVQYRLDLQENRIYTERDVSCAEPHVSAHLRDLLPFTRPGFTVLINATLFDPRDLGTLTIPENIELCSDYGVQRCAYLCGDFSLLGQMIRQVRLCSFKVDRGYFTRLEEAMHFLTGERAVLGR